MKLYYVYIVECIQGFELTFRFIPSVGNFKTDTYVTPSGVEGSLMCRNIRKSYRFSTEPVLSAAEGLELTSGLPRAQLEGTN